MNREGYCDLRELFRGDRRFRSFRIAVDASIRLTELFRRLHGRGGYIRSFQMTDIGIQPETGQVLAVNGDLAEPVPGEKVPDGWDIRYAPPEVINGKRDPDQFGDHLILSVLIFQFLTGGIHPLAGKRSVMPVMTQEARFRLYGTEPLFMFDPADGDNGPDPKLHVEAEVIWGILSEEMKECFLRAFGDEGLSTPGVRPTENDWREVLIRFQNRMVPCECGNILTDAGEDVITCDRCGREIPIGFRIGLEEQRIPAVRGNRIYRSRGEDGEEWDPSPVARVVGSQNNGNRLGVQNISGDLWQAITSKGKVREVKADEVIPLKDGIKCRYGKDIIEIIETESVGEK